MDRTEPLDGDFRAAFEQSAMAMCLASAESGTLLRINRRWCELTGYRAEDLLGRPLVELTDPRDQATARAEFARLLGGTLDAICLTLRCRRRDGTTFPGELTLHLVRDRDGRPRHTAGLLLDTGAWRLPEEELARLYRIGTVNELAAGLAHELSQPLTAIANYAGGSLRWLDDRGDPQQLRRALEAIADQATRMTALIQHLRRLITTGEPQRAPTDLNAALERACELLRVPLARKNVQLERALAPELPLAELDALQIEQVAIILLRNCIDAFTGQHLARPRIELATAATDSEVVLTIADNGPGVPPERLEHLFQAFYTTKQQGMGLGLMLARTIVQAHHGRILARAHAGGGLAVEVRLPISHSGDI